MKETYTIKINPVKESDSSRRKRIDDSGNNNLKTTVMSDKSKYSRKQKHKQELST